MKSIRIVVTQKDIDNGIRSRKESCPIAQSLKRRGFNLPYVSGASIVVGGGGQVALRFDHNDKTREFMRHFDLQGRVGVKPTIFNLKGRVI